MVFEESRQQKVPLTHRNVCCSLEFGVTPNQRTAAQRVIPLKFRQ